MSTSADFIDVGQGNMTLLRLDDGKIFLYDCNVTDENEDAVLGYVAKQIGWGANIDVFVCSHRDADHMRGVKRVHKYFPIQHIWDSTSPGTTTDSAEYQQYMDLRRELGCTAVERLKRWGLWKHAPACHELEERRPCRRCKCTEYRHQSGSARRNTDIDHASVMLTGDTDAATWKTIRQHYSASDLSCSLLLASHHGSVTYFDDPADEKYYYTDHLRAKSPAMTIISVGDNGYGHPDEKALELYEKHSTGVRQGYQNRPHGHAREHRGGTEDRRRMVGYKGQNRKSEEDHLDLNARGGNDDRTKLRKQMGGPWSRSGPVGRRPSCYRLPPRCLCRALLLRTVLRMWSGFRRSQAAALRRDWRSRKTVTCGRHLIRISRKCCRARARC